MHDLGIASCVVHVDAIIAHKKGIERSSRACRPLAAETAADVSRVADGRAALR